MAVVQRDQRVLFVQQAPHAGRWAGYWGPPGGAIEWGESQPDAVVRETLEEAGVLVRPLRKVWECPSAGVGRPLHWWLAEYVSGELATDPWETSAAAWLTVEEFLAKDRIFDSNVEFFRNVFPRLAREPEAT